MLGRTKWRLCPAPRRNRSDYPHHELFARLDKTDPQGYKAKKRQVYQHLMQSVQDLIPDVNRYIRLKLYGTPTTSEHFLGQPNGNIYGAKLIPQQVGLHRLGYRTEVENLLLVGASAGYPSVPGVIKNGINVVELLTGQAIWRRTAQRQANGVST